MKSYYPKSDVGPITKGKHERTGWQTGLSINSRQTSMWMERRPLLTILSSLLQEVYCIN